MRIRDRFGLDRARAGSAVAVAAEPRRGAGSTDRSFQELKLRVHRELLGRADLANLARLDMEQATAELRGVIAALIEEQAVPIGQRDRERLNEEILNEVYGLGPIEPLLRDPEISDILVNNARQVYIERNGKLEVAPVIFRDDAHLLQIIDRIVSKIGRRVDESSPMVDARLPDGSRVNAIIPPLALDGPVLSIRRFGRQRLTVDDLLRNASLTQKMVEMLRAMVLARLNILIAGGTGSGKTTLLNCLSAFIPDDERIVTIEDSAELLLQQPHVVRLETRPTNIEGKGEITQRDLLRNALRMRPDRIVLGEVRGGESLDMLQAMNTGHDGSLSTIHANSPRETLGRLELMMQLAGLTLPVAAMRQQLSSALDLIVQTSRLPDGTRRVTSITEIVGMEGDVILLQELWTFRREGVDRDGRIFGRFAATGLRPHFLERMKASAHAIDAQLLASLGD
ncbi:MAG: CpaF family protein [Candidatus Binatia bacterium]